MSLESLAEWVCLVKLELAHGLGPICKEDTYLFDIFSIKYCKFFFEKGVIGLWSVKVHNNCLPC